MSSKRDQFIDTTCELLELQGYHATGLNQIIAESGAPKGSLYYYFPDGKQELAAEAIARTGHVVSDRIHKGLEGPQAAGEAVYRFVCHVADQVEASGFRAGGPLTAVAMETATTNERLNTACREAFQRLQAAFTGKLVQSGFAGQRAAELATFITAAVEGGIILSRTRHSGDPLRRVAAELKTLLQVAQEAS
jgi:TetR/AcrR family transcriptional repressor of lmrAB and yxaGH operons